MKFLIAMVISIAFMAIVARADEALPPALQNIGIDQKLDQQLPMDLIFKDETGRDVRLGELFDHGRPVVLSFVYFRCPMLCTMVTNDLVRSLNALPMNVGQQF